ncbi:carboxypeptidase-like regulatory domain-containing protein [Paludibaculum fermentans]|uniref:carboxypeptidase-like regulatory domain-containing protein n=1 Tax=Paludibaculum fermentans TaxID=1473598 RepID=UPI003EB80C84
MREHLSEDYDGCMLRIAAGLFLINICVQAQGYSDHLLPQARHIAAKVLDDDGKPVEAARVDHTDIPGKAIMTDSAGRFVIDTRAPLIVIRKAGFQSEAVHTQDAGELAITLHKRGADRSFPTCLKGQSYEGIEGWSAAFQFPRISGVVARLQGQDVDYGARSYYIQTKAGRKGIQHGSGPMWSVGLPYSPLVWSSIQYEERSFLLGNSTIIDARGQLSNGQRWRFLGKFGESASYSEVDEAAAKELDKVLDGACAYAHAAR